MQTKLTLRMEGALVESAKAEALRRGKSVSQMVSEFFGSLTGTRHVSQDIPPVTASLVGILRRSKISEEAYKKHLREKYL